MEKTDLIFENQQLRNKVVALEELLKEYEQTVIEQSRILEEKTKILIQTEKTAAAGRLAGKIAHEMNNPMGVILGFAQSIVKRIKEDDPLYMPLKSIEREAIRCKKLVDDMLSYIRI